jgi:hypothetical protein
MLLQPSPVTVFLSSHSSPVAVLIMPSPQPFGGMPQSLGHIPHAAKVGHDTPPLHIGQGLSTLSQTPLQFRGVSVGQSLMQVPLNILHTLVQVGLG